MPRERCRRSSDASWNACCPSALRRFAQRVLWQPQDFYAHWTIASSASRSSSSPSRKKEAKDQGPVQARSQHFPIVFALKIFAFHIVFSLRTRRTDRTAIQGRLRGTHGHHLLGTIKASTCPRDIICDAFAFVNEAMWLKIALHVAEVVVALLGLFRQRASSLASNAPLMDSTRSFSRYISSVARRFARAFT